MVSEMALQKAPKPEGSLPQVASLRNATSGAHICGATVVGAEFALTAAHCVPSHPDQYVLQLNNYCSDGPPPTALVVHVIPNPLYDRKSSAHDIAALRIRFDINTINNDIMWQNGVVLPTTSFGASGDCKILGYGSQEAGSDVMSEVLLAGDVRMISLDECQLVLGPIAPDHDDGMFCALGDCADACQGDSGSPLVCGSVMEGIISYGLSCGKQGVPGVYTSVGAHLQWIHDVTGTNIQLSSSS